MKLTVLGKYGPFPTADGATSSYIIESGKTRVNMDFGSGALSRTLKVTNALPRTIVLSHLHFDHMSDLLPLVYSLSAPIDVYLPFDESPMHELISSLPAFNAIRITDGMSAKIGELDFTFTRLVHPVESYGMRISDGKSCFFYSGDTVFDERIQTAAKGCKAILLDACCPSSLQGKTPHMTIADARRIADITKARTLITHVHPSLPPEEEAAANGLEAVKELESYEI